MNPSPLLAIERLVQAHARGERLALFFDYDGTLTPIVAHPRLARLHSSTRRLLRRLTRPRVHVSLVSSRTIADLNDMTTLPGICLAGLNGLEIDIDGLRIVHPHADRGAALIAHLVARLTQETAAVEGAWVEDKRLGLTVHYRGVREEHARVLVARCRRALLPWYDEVRIDPGPRALEVFADLGWDKGTAVSHLVSHFGVDGGAVLYAGDGANDAPALQTVAALGGVAIGIGPAAPPQAAYRLATPSQLLGLMTVLVKRLQRVAERKALSRRDWYASYGLWARFFPPHAF